MILGGPNAISPAVQTALAAIAPTSTLSGDDRFGTSAAISAASYASGVDVAYVASGGDFPDALSGSAAATAIFLGFSRLSSAAMTGGIEPGLTSSTGPLFSPATAEPDSASGKFAPDATYATATPGE